MHSDSAAQQYEQALALAEAGQHEQALEQIVNYLQVMPNDGKAFNDAGTLLFCMQRGRDAIRRHVIHCREQRSGGQAYDRKYDYEFQCFFHAGFRARA